MANSVGVRNHKKMDIVEIRESSPNVCLQDVVPFAILESHNTWRQ